MLALVVVVAGDVLLVVAVLLVDFDVSAVENVELLS